MRPVRATWYYDGPPHAGRAGIKASIFRKICLAREARRRRRPRTGRTDWCFLLGDGAPEGGCVGGRGDGGFRRGVISGDLGAGLRRSPACQSPAGRSLSWSFRPPNRNPLFRRVYGLQLSPVPAIGGMISKTARHIEYLPASVDEFPVPECFYGDDARGGIQGLGRARSQSLGIAQRYIREKNKGTFV